VSGFTEVSFSPSRFQANRGVQGLLARGRERTVRHRSRQPLDIPLLIDQSGSLNAIFAAEVISDKLVAVLRGACRKRFRGAWPTLMQPCRKSGRIDAKFVGFCAG
jgi:hypothetical protein